jgi:hypothetical protein
MTARNEENATAAGGGAAAEPSRGTPPKDPKGGREERGNSATSRKHPPHVTENVDDETLQSDGTAADDVPSLPATAHGADKIPNVEQAQPINEESMYDGRPAEDKDRPPSSPTVP